MASDLKGELAVIPELGSGGQHSCLGSAAMLDRIGNKWTIMVLGALTAGPLRFNVLLRSIDRLSHRMLTLTLRKLRYDGLISRQVIGHSPVSVEYDLTEMGRSLIPHLRALIRWADSHKDRIVVARTDFERQTGGERPADL